MLRILLILTCLILNPAWAWNSGSHRLIAHIAWEELGPKAKTAITGLLRRHPDYLRWASTCPKSGCDAEILGEAATWPDDIRQDPRFHDEHEPPTQAITGLPESTRHRNWHYTDRQLDGSPREGRGRLEQVLPELIAMLANASAPVQQKYYALPWVLHLVGDIHQPLHVGSRHDKGGNLFEIEDRLDRRQPIKSLHRWWDALPATPWLRGKRLAYSARRLLHQYPATPIQGNPQRWLEESFTITSQQAYPPNQHISPAFRASAKATADRRVTEAGIRLGRLLQDIFGGVSRETTSE